MKWENVTPDITALPLLRLTQSWSALDVVKLLNYTQELPIVVINDDVRQKIINHISKSNVELGGLLLGTVTSGIDLYDGVIAICVEDSIESQVCESTHVSLNMDSSVWQLASEHRHGDSFVVGWYHSHPGLGAFFSAVDRRTQHDFFSHSYSLGLVIDPLRNEERWFIGQDSIELGTNRILKSTNALALV